MFSGHGDEASVHDEFKREAVAEAARLLGRRLNGPIILADTQNNPATDGTDDTVGLLRALMASRLPALVGVIHDPDAAAAAHAADVGATYVLPFGARDQSTRRQSRLIGRSRALVQDDFLVPALSTRGAASNSGRRRCYALAPCGLSLPVVANRQPIRRCSATLASNLGKSGFSY